MRRPTATVLRWCGNRLAGTATGLLMWADKLDPHGGPWYWAPADTSWFQPVPWPPPDPGRITDA